MTLTYDLEFEFATSDGFTSVKPDVRGMPVSLFWGLRSGGPADRVAESGTLSFVLDNSICNSGGLTGYYSPNHTNLRAGFAVGMPVMVTLTDGVSTLKKRFYISDIRPVPGIYRSNATEVTCVDFMGRLSYQYADTLTVQVSKRVDEALATLIALCPVAPQSTNYATGLETLLYVFSDVEGRRTTIMNAAQRLMQSDLGYLFADASSSDGEVLTYQTRQTRATKTSIVTLADTMDGLELIHTDRNIYNVVACVSYPAAIGSSDGEVLYTLQRVQELGSSESVTFTARYRDPNAGGESIRLYPGTEITPVAGTDYDMGSSSDGGSTDQTANLSVSVSWYADNAEVILTNTSNTDPSYVFPFQLRGIPIRLYDEAEAIQTDTSDNIARYGERPLRFALPYQDDPSIAALFATYILDKYKSPMTEIESVSFLANRSSTFEAAMLAGKIGEKFNLAETVTGLNVELSINGVEWIFEPGGFYRVRWYPERVTGGDYWYLGMVGYSELGEQTLLGL